MLGCAVPLVAVVGVAAGLSFALLAATLARMALAGARRRRTHLTLVALSRALRLLARELSAGATAPDALRVVVETDGGAGDLLAGVAVGAGSVRSPDRSPPATAVRRRRDGPEMRDVADVTARLRSAWMMSTHYGIPLAGVVGAVGDDVDDRRAAMDRRATATAGPTMSGYLLAGLPGAGLLLGTAMGARPVHVLTSTTMGGVLLLVGTLLTCAGLLWSDRMARA